MTMLELAERLGNAGFRWLVEACREPGADGGRRPIDDRRRADRLAAFETEIAGLRACAGGWCTATKPVQAGPADASVVKLYYSELLQRMMDFATEIAGPRRTPSSPSPPPAAGSRARGCSTSSGRGSGRSLAAPARSSARSSASAASGCHGSRWQADVRRPGRDPRRAAGGGPRPAVEGRPRGQPGLAAARRCGLARPRGAGRAGRRRSPFAEVAVVAEELGRAASRGPYLGSIVLGVGTLGLLEPSASRDEMLRGAAAGALVPVAVLAVGDGGVRGGEPAVPPPALAARAAAARRRRVRARRRPAPSVLLLLAADPGGAPVIVAADPQSRRAQPELPAGARCHPPPGSGDRATRWAA